jgi:hypothetical protein
MLVNTALILMIQGCEMIFGTVANQEAKRQAFMEDNVVSEWWNSGITQFENSKKYPISGSLERLRCECCSQS